MSMKVNFNIHYKTSWGEKLQVVVFADQSNHIIDLKIDSNSVWKESLNIASYSEFEYYYQIVTPNNEIVVEFGEKRVFMAEDFGRDYSFYDTWRWHFGEEAFKSTVFQDIFFKRHEIAESAVNGDFILNLRTYQIEPQYHLAVVGNQACLGNWDVSKKVKLSEGGYPLWTVRLNTAEIKFPLEYKYLIVETATNEVLAWGGGPNRHIDKIQNSAVNIVNDENFIRTIPSWKGAGVAIPVFSLRSKKSFGIGEFYDLKLMVDWAVSTGQTFIQTLPINDTVLFHSNYDSYPYNAVSVFALHPIYLNLEAIGKLKDKSRKSYFDVKKKELNAKTFSDYQNVMNAKWEYFKEIFEQDGSKTLASADFKEYFEENKSWLVSYAAFSFLRDKFGTPEFGKWPEFSSYNSAEIVELTSESSPVYKEIALFYYLQFHLHKQLTEVHQYAKSNGIAIKGDIPIGVSPKSVDAWTEPELFNTHMQAGAPPDDFSVTGQNWGFPTYNWELMANDNFSWWKKRFLKLQEYFDAYRIDHILGFFRIWEIPENDVWGLTGSFNPSLPLTVDELRNRGLWWDEDRMIKPYLKDHVIHSIFGQYSNEVCRVYLDTDGWQNFKFKPEFNTQKKIEKHFASLGYNFGSKEVIIRDGLYMLHCEVLFIRDARQPDKFHPRISLHSSATFKDLSDEQRRILDRIYVDYYYHRHNEFWKEQALTKLPALIASTNMLVCGEDLGMVPDSVPEVMNSLEILSLEIQRMPKKPGLEFAMPTDAPYMSVCTSSTHDMNPIRAWWEEDKLLIQHFYNRALGIQGPAPDKCEAWIAERIIRQHLESPAMLVILPLQDWLAMDDKIRFADPNAERINVPSNPRNFWCYRMHLNLEDLLKQDDFNEQLKTMITESGRN